MLTFRKSKTAHLEMRPVHVRLAGRTRAHALVVMLAYLIRRELARCWQAIDVTVEGALKELSTWCVEEVLVGGTSAGTRIPQPRESVRPARGGTNITVPSRIPAPRPRVSTKRKLTSRRKS